MILEKDDSPFLIIGAGAVATSLGVALVNAGVAISGVVATSLQSAADLAARLNTQASISLEDVDVARAIMICVPDDSIADVARKLARCEARWSESFVAHTSGSLTADALRDLSNRGALTASFHPLQSFPDRKTVRSFDAMPIGIEGTPDSVTEAVRLAHWLGARPVELTAESKVRYHLAATIASNHLVALLAVVGEILGAIDDADLITEDIYQPLISSTIENVFSSTPGQALSGPIARGDAETVSSHIKELKHNGAHLLPFYAALSTETVRLAVRSGRITEPVADAILDLLHKAME